MIFWCFCCFFVHKNVGTAGLKCKLDLVLCLKLLTFASTAHTASLFR